MGRKSGTISVCAKGHLLALSHANSHRDGAVVVQGVVTLPMGVSRHANASAPYVAGPENALLAAVLVDLLSTTEQKTTSRVPSPLVLLGPTGSGKSHLSRGLADHFRIVFGGDRVLLTTASDYRRDYAGALDGDSIDAWQRKLRSLDLFVIEDIDHLTTRVAVQDELTATLDALESRGSRVIVTSALPPAHLEGWSPELASRLSGGLTLEIAPLSPAARAAFIEQLLARCGWSPTPSIVESIASHGGNEPATVARRVATVNQRFSGGHGATLTEINRLLNEQIAAKAPALADMLRVVARYYGVTQRQITSASRQQEVVQARAMVIVLARQLTSLSYDQIGRRLGGRDHTTILHHHRKIESRLPTDVALRSALADLRRLVQT